MKYTIKNNPTMYGGLQFRSRLEARWAAFMDLAGWLWDYEPTETESWNPDFKVSFFCGHSECPSGHTLLVEVKPIETVEQLKDEKVYDLLDSFGGEIGGIRVDGCAIFGLNPFMTSWSMTHGMGGGNFGVPHFVNSPAGNSPDADYVTSLWNEAKNSTAYKNHTFDNKRLAIRTQIKPKTIIDVWGNSFIRIYSNLLVGPHGEQAEKLGEKFVAALRESATVPDKSQLGHLLPMLKVPGLNQGVRYVLSPGSKA